MKKDSTDGGRKMRKLLRLNKLAVMRYRPIDCSEHTCTLTMSKSLRRICIDLDISNRLQLYKVLFDAGLQIYKVEQTCHGWHVFALCHKDAYDYYKQLYDDAARVRLDRRRPIALRQIMWSEKSYHNYVFKRRSQPRANRRAS